MADNLNAEAALVPVREQTVDFYGDSLPAGQLADGTILVPLRPICEAIGLSWAGQQQRVQRDELLSHAVTVCVIHTVQGPRPMLALPLKLLPGWLFGVQAARVKTELRAKILRYQADCYEVLWNAFKGDILPPTPPQTNLSPAEQALMLAEAVAALARQQLELEGRYTTMADWMRPFVGATRRQLSDHEERLSALELHLGAGAMISETQAAEIAGAVKLVAAALEAAGTPNGYGRVYNELYHRYGISSYKMLPLGQFAAAMAWLRGWYTEVSGVGDGSAI